MDTTPPLRVKRNRLLRQHFFTSGQHFWEVELLRAGGSGSGRSALVVGVASSRSFESETLQGPLASWASGGAVGYAATGAVIAGGREVHRAAPYGRGDTVGVLLDMNLRRVAFFLNGKTQLAGQRTSKQRAGPHESGADCCVSWHPLVIDCLAVFPALTYCVGFEEVDVSMNLPLPPCN
ncbi:hypothetical protein PybrP1_001028 [[Pythium] brassicae (nom. inval.)]|nr:hypothetical protein PybrP1_001028 [[Pythium] brassicae (nom. inval.)]